MVEPQIVVLDVAGSSPVDHPIFICDFRFWIYDLKKFPPSAQAAAGMVSPNPWMILPFVLLLGAMALAPLLAPGWWLRHYAKVALGLGAVTLGYYVLILQRCAARSAHGA